MSAPDFSEEEATAEARRRWGPKGQAFRCRVAGKPACWVGVEAGEGDIYTEGEGATFREAFAAARATTGEAGTLELISAVATAHRARAAAQAAVATSTVDGSLTVHQVEAADLARAAFELAVLELLVGAGAVAMVAAADEAAFELAAVELLEASGEVGP